MQPAHDLKAFLIGLLHMINTQTPLELGHNIHHARRMLIKHIESFNNVES